MGTVFRIGVILKASILSRQGRVLKQIVERCLLPGWVIEYEHGREYSF
jgi:hypothetical protein